MPTTYADLIRDALIELGVLNATDPAGSEDAEFALGRLNYILDAWNVQRPLTYESEFLTFTITPGLQPHTIGPASSTPTWAVTGNRPVSIEAANLIDTSVTPNTRIPLSLRNDAWWANVRVRALTATYPTDLFYEAAFPKGSVNLWPVPTVAYGIELLVRFVLSQVALTDTVSLPPGYAKALMLTLAEELAGPFKVAAPPMLNLKAAQARAAVQAANAGSAQMSTDYPGAGGGGFNWITREIG